MSGVARSRALPRSVLGVVGAGLLMVVTASAPLASTALAGSGGGGADLRDTYVSFRISGDTTRPLAPGVTVPVNLRFTNPHRLRVWVRAITVTVRRVDAPRSSARHPCTQRDFTVDQASRRLVLPVAAHATRSLRSYRLGRVNWPHISMRNRPVNQDGCKAASLRLGYSASGTWDH